jgi:hypothetical protein
MVSFSLKVILVRSELRDASMYHHTQPMLLTPKIWYTKASTRLQLLKSDEIAFILSPLKEAKEYQGETVWLKYMTELDFDGGAREVSTAKMFS